MVSNSAGPEAAAARLQRLRNAIAVIDEGGIDRAARRCGIEEHQLARAIDEIEARTGLELLDRGSHPTVPTSDAHQFAADVRAALVRPTPHVTPRRRSALRLGFPPYLGIEALHLLLAAMRERDATLEIQVTHGLSGEQIARLRSGYLDLGVLRVVRREPGLHSEPLFPAPPMTAFVPADHRLAARAVITAADVRDEDLVMTPRVLGPATYDWWVAALARAGYRFRHVRSSAGIEPQDLIAAVDDGSGIGVAMADFVPPASLGTRVVMRALDPSLPTAQTVLAWPAEHPRELDHAIAVARAAAQDLSARAAGDEPLPPGPTLTPRELEILRLAAEGLSAPAIATRLTISVATVRSHFENVYRKLGTGDRAAAVAIAFRHGLLR